MKNWQRLCLIGWLCALLAGAAGCSVPAPTPTAAAGKLRIYAPASTSSIPVLLAARQLPGTEVTLYTSQEQANTLFARGEVDLLVSGLSVGADLYRNGIPLQMINTYVSGMSFLVGAGSAAGDFAALKGAQLVVPFAGSPIEEVCRYLAAQAGLEWGRDILPLYAPFDTSMALLRQGKSGAVILPEPNVSLLEAQGGVAVGLSLYDLWNQYNPGDDGYPQVGTFALRAWAAPQAGRVAAFNAALGQAIAATRADPAAAAAAVAAHYKFPEAVLRAALGRTHYALLTGAAMRARVEHYYQVIGKPLDETYRAFYYLAD